MLTLFHSLIAAHIAFGTVGLISFWVPVLGRKGTANHKRWGRVFFWSILGAGCFAVLLSICTLIDPHGTHPNLDFPTEMIRGIFGVMMLHLAVLTINLVWYGRETILNKTNHVRDRQGLNLWLQPLLLLAALGCVLEGLRLGQPLIMLASVIGFATVATNLGYMLNPKPAHQEWLKEHVKAIVGGGISVYTAFFAFGAVRLMPELALNPLLWAVPLAVGLGIILWHHARINAARARVGRVQAAE